MHRTTPRTAAALLGLALLTPTTLASSATAAGETCRGEVATIVGTTPTLTGTEARDVIVTGTATSVEALGGDDLVCVTGGGNTNQVSVNAGLGNDVVDTTALGSAYDVTVVLGRGADTFTGGASDETVATGFLEYWDGTDADTDTVRTGAGDDRVFVGSYPEHGEPFRASTDVVDLGPGDDIALWARGFGTEPGAVLTGGAGNDRLSFGLNGQRSTAAIDMAAGTVQVTSYGSAAVGRFASFESAEIEADIFGMQSPIIDVIDFRGTSGNDELIVHHDRSGSTRMAIDTGAGDDRVLLDGVRLRPGSRIDTGRGEDRLVAAQHEGRLGIDLTRGMLRTRAVWLVDEVVSTVRVAGIENAFLMAPESKLVGDGSDNDLAVNGCRATLRGGGGGDRLTSIAGDPWFDAYSYDCTATTTMSGGPGTDRLRGGAGKDRLRGDAGPDRLEGRGGNDVLLGGTGRDKADGGKGRDRCAAEKSRRCER